MFDAPKDWMRHYGHCDAWCIHQSLEGIDHPKDSCFCQMEQKQEDPPPTKRMMMTIVQRTM